ncbi:iron ABC transporter substrate-binding protein [Pseudomonas sp. FH4]|uniref:ABC transporter substrate-binding protein n=1 Tax=Pseudomonas brenneri TaxID=129817 RepID=A0A5B2UW28_9PSED|nr:MULTISPECIES: ABC transporter substrate-binding protein [Pseudomonas fluorescens group]ETK20696.1 iron ABC transporter substrate-binding protein [Pseudomonas sp. FH4]KAA2230688.1 ABC transporter substrate-binding protein [Pseudomonas brenneri]MBF8006990.1 ABC transporter substrate-binding protein [Pseudomonas brenneri]TWR77563.1 iron ABC transporter substrate-binding protein [Pseudomonas brenneri]WJM89431.1 ABC transporter substrate-binding protein [Pseudomonas brenneri]
MKRLGGFAIALLWSASALADGYRNCQQDWRLPHAPPSRIVALNQHAADMLLALGAGPTLVGVAYLDDNGAAHQLGQYLGVPVIAPRYPASEVLYGQRPDLVVGGFATAFGNGITSRTGLAGNGVGSYLLESACAGHSLDFFGHIRNDLLTLGNLLHKPQRARDLIDALDADLARAQALARPEKPLSVFYLDSEVNGLDSEGGQGFVTALLAAAGARNLFAGVNQYRVTVSSETLLISDPDVILLADAVWSPASRKRQLLTRDPVLSRLRAVRENRMIDIPFTHLVPNVGSAQVVLDLARELNAL